MPNNWEMESLLNDGRKNSGLSAEHPFRQIEFETDEILFYGDPKKVIASSVDEDKHYAVNLRNGLSESIDIGSGPDFLLENGLRHTRVCIWPVRGKMILKEKTAIIRQRYLQWSMFAIVYSIVCFFVGITGLLDFSRGTLHEWSWGMILRILFVYTPVFFGLMAVILFLYVILLRVFRKWRWDKL